MKRPHLHVVTILTVLAACLLSAPAGPPGGNSLLGTAQVTGPVLLNGQPITGPGMGLGDGDRLETGKRGSVLIMISMRDGILLAENSGITLRAGSAGVSAQLQRGRVRVTSVHERLREVRLSDEAVSIRAEPGAMKCYQVTRLLDATYVHARAGAVSIFDEGYATHTEVPEGKVGKILPEAEVLKPPQRPAAAPVARPADSGQQTARAGQITAAVPKEYIVRARQQQSEGRAGDEIQWEDLLRTEPRGRVRLVLDDGSILNIGSDSRLKVIRHDAQTQQSDLEMRYGRLRAQVVKLSRPNSRFEIRTATAVCGVLGTDFYVEANAKTTRVVVFKGVVKVTPLLVGAVTGVASGGTQAGSGASGQAGTAGTGQAGTAGATQATTTASTTVTAGQATTAAVGSISAPVSATAAQIQTAVAVTQASTAATSTAAAATVAASRVAVVSTAAVPAAATAAITVPSISPSAVSPIRP
jgi:ferric-dicitrate binding protein FerR (iron transport regulator)